MIEATLGQLAELVAGDLSGDGDRVIRGATGLCDAGPDHITLIDAVEKGQFHIYQVAAIEEGIQILTGKEAGSPDEQGNYPKDTVFGNVQKKLQSYYEKELQIRKQLNSQ